MSVPDGVSLLTHRRLDRRFKELERRSYELIDLVAEQQRISKTIAEIVAELREGGFAWRMIGFMLDCSGQTAARRYGGGDGRRARPVREPRT